MGVEDGNSDKYPIVEAKKPILSTEQTQPPVPEEPPNHAERPVSELSTIYEYDRVRANFTSDYEACFHIAKVIAEQANPQEQMEYYGLVRRYLVLRKDAQELTTTMTLAWYDYHYKEEPSKLIAALNLLDRNDLPQGKELVSLVLSLLHSGYSSKTDLNTLEGVLNEILLRRAEFKKRVVAGEGVHIISFEYDLNNLSSKAFTQYAENMGAKTTTVNCEREKDFKSAFLSNVARSDPNKPLTILLMIHGMALEGGYLSLPNDERITPKELALAIKTRGNSENVILLTTQCLPRSSRREDSFYDHFNRYFQEWDMKVPIVYMESMENQTGILSNITNPSEDGFQTLRIAREKGANKTVITGTDILDASNDVIGNQPSIIIPPNDDQRYELNDNLTLKDTNEGVGLKKV